MRRTHVAAALVATLISALTATSANADAGRTPATSRAANGRIAFVRHHQIFTVTKTGRHLEQLTHTTSGEPVSQPTWSPRGKRIAYTRREHGTSFVWVMNADGTDKQQLWRGSEPAWSPSGKRLAYITRTVEQQAAAAPTCLDSTMYVRSLAGGSPTEVYDLFDTCGNGANFIGFGRSMAWSRNGKTIYVGAAQSTQVSTNGRRRLATTYDNVALVFGIASDGSDITGNSDPKLLKRSECTVDDAPARLTTDEYPTVDVSPYGHRAIYVLPCTSNTDNVPAGWLREESLDGKTLTVFNHDSDASLPAYSPNGEKVLYVHRQPGLAPSIRRVDLSTGRTTRILIGATEPDQQPVVR